MSIPYSIVGLCKFGLTLPVAGHWMACAWCVVVVRGSFLPDDLDRCTPFELEL